jgi:hypothetical protein
VPRTSTSSDQKDSQSDFFPTHFSRQEDITDIVGPEDFYWYSLQKGETKLGATQKNLHRRILVRELVEKVMIGEWQKERTRSTTRSRNEQHRGAGAERGELARSVNKDGSQLAEWVLAPLAECLGANSVRSAGRPDN